MKPTFEEISELREEWEATLPPAAYRERMLAQVKAMAVGDPGRAELLECLASSTVPVSERSVELAQEAIADGGPTTVDPRVELVRVFYVLGRADEADALVRELMRARPRDDVLRAATGCADS